MPMPDFDLLFVFFCLFFAQYWFGFYMGRKFQRKHGDGSIFR